MTGAVRALGISGTLFALDRNVFSLLGMLITVILILLLA